MRRQVNISSPSAVTIAVDLTLPAVVKTRQSLWHEDNLVCSLAQVCDVCTSPPKLRRLRGV